MDLTPSLPLTEATETVDGVALYYRMGGSGPPLVLLHGFTAVGLQWDCFLDELGKDYTVIVPDLPGMGRSGRPKGDFTHREAGRLTFRLMDALGIDRFRGIGHSSGGIMLLHMALQQPGRMEAIVPVAGAHRLPLAVRQERRARAGNLEGLDANWLVYLRSIHPVGESQIRWILGQFDRFADEYGDFDLSPEHLATIETPALLVWGDRDANFYVEYAIELYRSLPNAMLWVIPGHEHMAVWSSEEARVTFPTVVHKFFQRELS